MTVARLAFSGQRHGVELRLVLFGVAAQATHALRIAHGVFLLLGAGIAIQTGATSNGVVAIVASSTMRCNSLSNVRYTEQS